MTVLFDNLRAESAWWGSRIKRLQSFLGAFELMQDRLLSSRTTGNCWKSAHAGNGRGSHTVHIACTLDTFIRTHSGSSSLCTACHVSCFPHNAHSAGEVGFGGHICRCRCRVSLPNERPGMMPPCERTVLGLQRISHTIPRLHQVVIRPDLTHHPRRLRWSQVHTTTVVGSVGVQLPRRGALEEIGTSSDTMHIHAHVAL